MAADFLGAAFMIVNAVRIVAMTLERRPVVLSDKEEQLYRVAFSSIDKREFLRLVSLARWVDARLARLFSRRASRYPRQLSS